MQSQLKVIFRLTDMIGRWWSVSTGKFPTNSIDFAFNGRTLRFLCAKKAGKGGDAPETQTLVAPFDKKMNVTGKRMEDSIKMLDAGALFTRNNKRDPNLPAVTATAKSKLNLPLEAREKKRETMNHAQKGLNQAVAEDIHEILSDALSSPKLRNLFRGTKDASILVDIKHVKVNSDVSHVYAEWQCDLLEAFAREMHDSMGSIKAKAFVKRAVNYVTGRLAAKESFFRTALMRQMQFKKVPRIYFTHESTAMLTAASGETERMRQAKETLERLRRSGN